MAGESVIQGERVPLIPRGYPRRALIALGAGAVLTAIAIVFDGPISDFFREAPISGDFKRELRVLQQWGAPASAILCGVAIFLLDRARARRMLDYLLAIGPTMLVVVTLKSAIERARPQHEDPGAFFGSLSEHRVVESSSELRSMPSGHTASAVVLSVFLVCLYPRLRPLGIAMVALVGASRLILGAHYLSDVLAGAAIAWVVAWPVVYGYWGVRLLDWIWVRAVDRKAEPALARVLEVGRVCAGRENAALNAAGSFPACRQPKLMGPRPERPSMSSLNHSSFTPLRPVDAPSGSDAPQSEGSSFLRYPWVKWLTLGLLALAGALALASWGWLAFYHAKDRYLTNHPPGVWMALAQSAAEAELYPPLHGEGRFGGTRYAPIPIVAHAMVSRITGEFLLSGKLWNYAQGLLAAATLFVVVRSRGRKGAPVPVALALALSMGWLACQTGMIATLTVRNDGLPLALQLMAAALIARCAGAASCALAAALCALATLSKMSAVWAPGALGLWLLVTNWRMCFLFAGVYAAALAGGLYGVNFFTEGRFFDSLSGSTGTMWKGGGAALFAPVNMAWHLIDSAQPGLATIPLALLAIGLAAARRLATPFHLAWVCCVGTTLLLYADVGIAENHLIDLLALSAVLCAELWTSVEPTSRERRELGRGLAPAQAVMGAMITWAVLTGWTRHTLAPVKDAVREALSGERDGRLRSDLLHAALRGEASILSEDPYWPVSLGQRPTVLDPFMLMRFGESRPEWVQGLEARIRAREFDVIVLLREADPDDSWYRASAFGPGPIGAIRDSYEQAERIDGYFIYRRPEGRSEAAPAPALPAPRHPAPPPTDR